MLDYLQLSSHTRVFQFCRIGAKGSFSNSHLLTHLPIHKYCVSFHREFSFLRSICSNTWAMICTAVACRRDRECNPRSFQWLWAACFGSNFVQELHNWRSLLIGIFLCSPSCPPNHKFSNSSTHLNQMLLKWSIAVITEQWNSYTSSKIIEHPQRYSVQVFGR